MNDSASEFARGAAWLFVLSVLGQLVALGTGVIAARQLGPEPYGAYALIVWALGMLQILREPGLSTAIASGRLGRQDELAAAQSLVFLLGLGLTGVLALAAPWLETYFATPLLATPLRVAALSLVIGAFGVLPQAELQHRRAFRSLAVLALVQQLLQSGVTLVMLWRGAGLWSLVLPLLVGPLVGGLGGWGLLGRWPRISWRMASLGRHRGEGSDVLGVRVLNHLVRNADDWIVGRLFGAAALGHYAFAYSFLRRPVMLLSQALSPPLIVLAGRRDIAVAERDARIAELLGTVARVFSPIPVVLAAVCQLWVPWVFGAHWEPAIPFFRLFLLLASLQLVGSTLGSVWLGLGKTRGLLWLSLVSSGCVLAGFLLGAWKGGPLGVATGYVVASGALLIPHLWLTERYCGVAMRGTYRVLVGALFDQAVAFGVTYTCGIGLDAVFGAPLRPPLRLGLALTAGCASYWALLRWLRSQEYDGLVRAVRGLLRARAKS